MEKTKRNSILILLVMLVSLAFAGNTDNTPFSYYCGSIDGATSYRAKFDNSKVYLYPMSGTYINYKVQGKVSETSTNIINASGYQYLGIGTQYSLTNMAYEWGLSFVRIRFNSPNVPVTVAGVWSPDSVGTYTVVPLGL